MVKKIILILILSMIFIIRLSYSIENIVAVKINNEIITSLDIEEEVNYLSSLNSSLKDLERSELLLISKNSLIKEKIREIELLKYKQNLEITDDIFEKVIIMNYSKLGINTKEKFLEFIKSKNIEYGKIKKKLTIEIFWNELILSKFGSKVKIDEKKLKKQIENSKKRKNKSFLIQEIVFNIQDKSQLEFKFKEIEESIKNRGFKNTALIYSVSETSKSGGEIGWINENSLNDLIKKNLLDLKMGEYTKPILTPGGFVVLKLDDVRESELEIDLNNELEKLIKQNTNQQLNQFSNLYFNKIKNNTIINE